MSNPNIEQITAAQKANTEVLLALLRTAFNGVEQLTALNVAASRDFFNNSVANSQQLMAAKDVNAVAKLNTELAQPNLQKLVDYTRNVYELTTNVQKELTSVIEAQYGKLTKDATSAMQKATAQAPVGGDVFAAALNSVISASNQAFESLNSVTRQLSEIAEANIQTATKAAGAKAPAAKTTAAKAPAKTSATAAAAKKVSAK
ncbi:MAG: granule-associated-like protein [Betaproteobacteria bacterium HGW-Betaproteobacteria-6]|jgi:phasin family protein|nr:MAG: granule-associated-like protein [Betaproteobacteria bacterium HGW-Betaproteobacteria-6]